MTHQTKKAFIKTGLSWMQLGFSALVVIFFSALPAQAQNVTDQIQALKNRLAELETQQIEIKKEATEAAAALPTFSYRPGNGLLVEAADKSWGLRTSMETHFRWNFESGKDQADRTQGETWGRRFRPYWFFCVNNCLWEIETALDLDASPTGNVDGNQLQRGAVHFHAENLNPFLPEITFGMDISTAAAATISRQGSSAVGAQREYDIESRQNGPNTGSAANGISWTWDNRSLASIGIPGRITRYQFAMANVGEGGDGSSSFSDRKNFTTYIGLEPFSQLKNKWIRGLFFEFGAWFCNVDGSPSAVNASACTRSRFRDHGDLGAQTIYDTGANSMGKGLFTFVSPGFQWVVGPYKLRVMGGFAQSEDGSRIGGGSSPGKKRSHNFLIGHDLFVWSPKGFLTGSANTAGSILVGTHFERNDASCGDRIRTCGNINGGQFHRETVLLREWDIWYFIMPRMSAGLTFLWYNASNLRNTKGQAANNYGICSDSKIASGGCRSGIGGNWLDWSIDWRYQF
jgi:hypothetical protein